MNAALDDESLELADIPVERLSAEDKEVLFTDAVLLANVDDIVLPSERGVLVKLADRLGLAKALVDRIFELARDEAAISLSSRALEDRVSALPAMPPPPAPPSTRGRDRNSGVRLGFVGAFPARPGSGVESPSPQRALLVSPA